MILILLALFTKCLLADQTCPFPSCESIINQGKCEITCNSKTVPSISNSTKEISFVEFKNLEQISARAFEDLKIKQLIINSSKLESVDVNAFVELYELEMLDLTNVYNLSLFFSGSIRKLENLTHTLSIVHSNLTTQDVNKIIQDLKSWSKLTHLSFKNNLIETFNYNFENFTSLKSLYLDDNLIENISLVSPTLEFLGLGSNFIKSLEDSEFFHLPNMAHLDVGMNRIEHFQLDHPLNVSILSLTGNKIQKLERHSFENLTKIQNLFLNENNITEIDNDAFCDMKGLSILSLSSNPINFLNLSCLNSLEQLIVSNISMKGLVTQNEISNSKNLTLLNLSHNQIENLDFENLTELKILYLNGNNLSNLSNKTTRSICNLLGLDISKNNISNLSSVNLQNLEKLQILFVSENLLTKIDYNDLIKNADLMEVDFGFNYIEEVYFPQLDDLFYLYLSGNKIKNVHIDNFNKLKNLKYLYLSENEITKIDSKSFSANIKLEALFLDNNRLKTIPDIHQLENLDFFELSNNSIVSLPNNVFEKKQKEGVKTRIDLRNNNITRFSSKVFCSRFSQTYGLENTRLYFDNLNSMDKCLLTQIRSNSRINLNETTCGINYFATLVNVTVFGINYNQSCSIKNIDECKTSFYTCPKNDDLVRFTTWITGDPHVYSYKRKYQLCNLEEENLCLQHKKFSLICYDQMVKNFSNATVLTSVEFIYTSYDGKNFSIKFDNQSFPDKFSNSQKIIIDEIDGKNESVAVEILDHGNLKILVLHESKTHIFVSKNKMYLSLTVRARHDTYAESTGVLYQGCSMDQSEMKRRKKRDISNCSKSCNEVDFRTSDENIAKEDLEKACYFDCSVLGPEAVQLLKESTDHVVSFLNQSDEYFNMLNNSEISTYINNIYINFFIFFILKLI